MHRVAILSVIVAACVMTTAGAHAQSGAAAEELARLQTDDGWVQDYPSDIQAILDIPPRQRAVLFLVEIEGMPYAEAAEQLGITTVAARALANRARRKARQNVEVSNG